jgi:hypothetical protein
VTVEVGSARPAAIPDHHLAAGVDHQAEVAPRHVQFRKHDAVADVRRAADPDQVFIAHAYRRHLLDSIGAVAVDDLDSQQPAVHDRTLAPSGAGV